MIAVVLLIVCAGVAKANFLEVLSGIPSAVSSAFSETWRSFKEVVNKPVRIKRLGRGGRRKVSTGPPIILKMPVITPETTPTTTQTTSAHLVLPFFTWPRWRSQDRWAWKQQPISHVTHPLRTATTAGAITALVTPAAPEHVPGEPLLICCTQDNEHKINDVSR